MQFAFQKGIHQLAHECLVSFKADDDEVSFVLFKTQREADMNFTLLNRYLASLPKEKQRRLYSCLDAVSHSIKNNLARLKGPKITTAKLIEWHGFVAEIITLLKPEAIAAWIETQEDLYIMADWPGIQLLHDKSGTSIHRYAYLSYIRLMALHMLSTVLRGVFIEFHKTLNEKFPWVDLVQITDALVCKVGMSELIGYRELVAYIQQCFADMAEQGDFVNLEKKDVLTFDYARQTASALFASNFLTPNIFKTSSSSNLTMRIYSAICNSTEYYECDEEVEMI